MPLPRSYVSSRGFRSAKGRGKQISAAALLKQSWTDPTTADADGISASHTGAASAGTRDMTIGGALASGGVARFGHARNVVITVTHASSVVAMSGVIYGTDIHGRSISEAWSVTATGTSKTFTGKKAFKTVTRITEVVAADASANSIVAGDGVVLGLECFLSVASAVKEIAAGSVVTNGTFVAGSSAADADALGTYSPNSAPNGSTDYTVYYISDNPEID